METAPCSVLTKYMMMRNNSPANTAHGRICRMGMAGSSNGMGAWAACDMSPPRARAARSVERFDGGGSDSCPGGTYSGATVPGSHRLPHTISSLATYSAASTLVNLAGERRSMTTRLVLVCHGATSATRRAAFPADEPLEHPDPVPGPPRADVVLCAPHTRCHQTAAALGLDPTPDTALRDRDS